MKRILFALAALFALLPAPAITYAQTLTPLCIASTLPNAPTVTCGSTIPITVGGISAGGTTFTLGTGAGACATTSTLVGGATAGSFVCTGTAGASTQVVNLPASPQGHGWACWCNDFTSGVAGETVAPASATAATLKVTIATTSDVVQFGCIGY